MSELPTTTPSDASPERSAAAGPGRAGEEEMVQDDPGFDVSPIRKAVVVELGQEAAFLLFTQALPSWWPVGSHSIGGARAREARFQGGLGGRIYEVLDDGTEYDWGRVMAWEPPQRFVCSWDPSVEARTPTEGEVRFLAERADRTRVELEHRGWEQIGERARLGRESYAGAGGWTEVLGGFVRVAQRSGQHGGGS
jgi:uncharacterized protein YndB with AHSA1/START domain